VGHYISYLSVDNWALGVLEILIGKWKWEWKCECVGGATVERSGA